MKSCEFAVSISALACCIAEGKSPEEIALISSIFMQLGDTLSTIAARDALCGSSNLKRDEESCGKK